MENPAFVVSARKYRPVTFDSVVGQGHITTTLKNAIRIQHLASAFLFCGPRGVGKTTCARILAKTINCQHLDDSCEPCGECVSCVAFQQNASLNIHELDAASNNSVEDIRNLIDQVRYPPSVGTKKVYIIDEVHMLSASAFNAFLKTLEEPPSYAIFILATTEKHKILPTILSRCQIFDFNRIQPRDIAEHLAYIAEKEAISVENEALEVIAEKADGGLRDALSMFDLNVTFSKDNTLRYADVLENLHILDYSYYFKITDALLAEQLGEALLIFDEIIEKGFDGHEFVVGLCGHFRNLLVCKTPATIKLLRVAVSVQGRYAQQAGACSESFLLSALSIGNQCDIHYKQAKQQRLHVEITLAKMAHLNAVLVLPDAPLEAEKKKPEPVVTPPVRAEEPPPTPYPTPRTAARRGKMIQLDEPVKTVQNTENEAIKSENNQPYEEVALKIAWTTFMNTREKMNERVLLDRNFVHEGGQVSLVLDNPVQLELLNELRTELMTYLRETLQNDGITLQAVVAEANATRQPYTQAEKFNFLAERNPALHELREALGLVYDW